MSVYIKRRKFMIDATGIGCGALMGSTALRPWAQRTADEEISPIYAESTFSRLAGVHIGAHDALL